MDAIRFTLTLDQSDNKILLALQAHMQMQQGKRVPLSEVIRECMRATANVKKIKIAA